MARTSPIDSRESLTPRVSSEATTATMTAPASRYRVSPGIRATGSITRAWEDHIARRVASDGHRDALVRPRLPRALATQTIAVTSTTTRKRGKLSAAKEWFWL